MANITGTNLGEVLVGTNLADTISGLGGNDTLNGLGGDDRLDGGLGNDIMVGGLGNDTYVIDSAADGVVEAAGQGTDTVLSSVNYTLAVNVENLTLSGAATSGTGNVLNNVIIGNASNNTLFGLAGSDVLSGLDGNDFLDGGAGIDTLTGGLGNDTFVVDNAGDVVVENAGQGTDLVLSSITYTLGANVENLTLTGAANINGTGNILNNVIQGNVGANSLSGLGGNDIISGNDGNDTLTGGDGVDTLNGGNGNDSLIGGAGNDTLVGGAGQDAYKFITPNEGIDTISFVVADDTIQVVRAAFPVIDPATGNPVNLALGALNAGQFRLGAGAADANDYFIYNPATGALSFDRNGSGAGSSVQIAQLAAGLAMTNLDIVVVA